MTPKAAIDYYRKAVSLDPKDPRAIYALALAIERQGGAGSEDQFQKLIEQILAVRPDNLAALVELSRISAKRGDSATLRSAVQRIAAQSSAWPPDVKQELAALEAAASGADPELGRLAQCLSAQCSHARSCLPRRACPKSDLAARR